MGDIAWTDRSDWNPIRGCTRVSPGCGGPGPHGGCYAEAMATRFSDPGMWGHGYAERVNGVGRWTGKVAVQWERLSLPLKWRKPAKIFANSTNDLFHEALPMAEIATIYAVAVAAVHVRGHVVQILTKRADRMREVLNEPAFWDQVNAEAGAHVMENTDPLDRRRGDARATCRDDYGPDSPPSGIWLGVSVEDQKRANERIPELLQTPAAIRFLSCEPLLEAVALDTAWHGESALNPECWGDCGWCINGHPPLHNCRRGRQSDAALDKGRSGVDWVITGGESGLRARPFDIAWARSIVAQCKAAGVAVFIKQLGARPNGSPWDVGPRGKPPRGRTAPEPDGHVLLADKKGANDAEWPEDLRVQEFPDTAR